jgi:large subunit ribosomal protein L35
MCKSLRRRNIMPKMKTSRAAAKRFKKTGTGKLKRVKAYKRHILTKKSSKTKRNLRKSTMTDSTNEKNMKKILPYL